MADATPPAAPSKTVNFGRIGNSGLNTWGGVLSEELHQDLRGPLAVKAFKAMRDNASNAASALLAFETLIKQTKWKAIANEDPNVDQTAAANEAKYLDSIRSDMSQTWSEVLSEISSCLWAGFEVSEIVLKIRRGPNETDPKLRSKHTDGRIGVLGLENRPQDTMIRWDFDEVGATAMIQRRVNDFKEVKIPLAKCCHFRPSNYKNNPEGRSLFRAGYRDDFFARKLEVSEVLGVHRSLVGMFVLQVPPHIMLAGADADDAATYADAKAMAERIHLDQQGCLVIGAEEDRDGKTGWKAGLLASPGAPANADVPIRRHRGAVLLSMVAGFLDLAQAKTGSFALSDNDTELFAMVVGAFLDMIDDVLNTTLVPMLMTLNGVPTELWPKFQHGDIEIAELTQMANFVSSLLNAGAIGRGPVLARFLREYGGIPPEAEGEEMFGASVAGPAKVG